MIAADIVADSEAEVSPKRRRGRSLWTRAAVVVAIVGVAFVAARVWYRGGTRLRMDSAGLGVHPVRVGRPVSFGVGLTTTGGSSVVVEKATAEHSANIDVRYSIMHTTRGQLGIGTADGTIPGSTPLGTRGIRVGQPAPPEGARTTCTVAPVGASPGPNCAQPPLPSQPDQGATWLVVTVTARRPGPWSVTHFTVTYSSWWRTRTATSGYVVSGQAPR